MTSVYYDTFTTSRELPLWLSGSYRRFPRMRDIGVRISIGKSLKTGNDSSTAKRSATGVSVVDLRPSNKQTNKQTLTQFAMI